jgi:predicted GH43/DUF377 family glycosyl hydrolase
MQNRVFRLSPENPLIGPLDVPFPAAAVLNPGAAEQQGQTVLLLRIEDHAGFSNIHVARSDNGVTDWKIDSNPILAYGQEDWRYEQWGCEDARVTYLEEDNCWYITYTAYSPEGAAVALARSTDLVTAERIGLILSPNNKDAVLFSRKFDGRWAALHRPDAGGEQHIWSVYSPDLVHWGEPHSVLSQEGGSAWDSVKVGAGPPPLLVKDGWLLIYHGVKGYGGHLIYRAGAALLDKDKPYKVVARTRDWLFQAEAPYEFSGLTPNVVFPTGLLLRGDQLWMYYGAADTTTCLATAKLDDVLALLQ